MDKKSVALPKKILKASKSNHRLGHGSMHQKVGKIKVA
jgi:hypothetical protein